MQKYLYWAIGVWVVAIGLNYANNNYDDASSSLGAMLKASAEEAKENRAQKLGAVFASLSSQTDLFAANRAHNEFDIVRAANTTKRTFLEYAFDNDDYSNAAVLVLRYESAQMMWLTNLRTNWQGEMVGDVIASSSQYGIQYGQKYVFDVHQIRDWAITMDGKVYGLFVARHNVDMYLADKEEQVRALLSETPMPASWTNS